MHARTTALTPSQTTGDVGARDTLGPVERRPLSHWRWRRTARAILAVLDILGIVVVMSLLLTRGVDDAPGRVAAVDAMHRTVAVTVTADATIARATVAAEDEHFYSHHGVDPLGLLRATWGGITGVDNGGSTLDQQLAKVLYEGGQTSVLSRVSETAIALKIDGRYTKTAILSMYVDAVYYGHGYYGIAAAAAGYFGVAPDQLTWGEAALLAGLPQAPTLLDPYRDLAAARQRQKYVLGRLVAMGALTESAADVAAATPPPLRTAA